ncbi:hypothetical protein Fmac_029805 [Flemingia macrophylla]|uniref:Uncharacterized protein n=1 Tax=Flemingia macrophylla TaxID=520843 RepID=A0ABD1LBJ3_9FABA
MKENLHVKDNRKHREPDVGVRGNNRKHREPELEFEESAETIRQEIQEYKNKLDVFEDQMEDGRNEGLFFKNLRKKTTVDKVKAKEEAEKIKDVTREKAGSGTRKNIYLFFVGLLSFAIVDSIASTSTDWRNLAVLGAILVDLVSQFIYEQNMS